MPATDNSPLFKALVAFQKDMTNVAKTETANTGKFGYKYANIAGVIEAIKGPLAAQGLCYSQMLTTVDGKPGLLTLLAHESGAQLSAEVAFQGDLSDPQKFGGVCTYYRRYALLGILGLATDDDDAQSATQTSQQRQPATQSRQQAQTPESPPEQRPGAAQGADEDMTWTEFWKLIRSYGIPDVEQLELYLGRSIKDMTAGAAFDLYKIRARGEATRTPGAPAQNSNRKRGTLTDKQLNAIRVMLPKKGMDEKAWNSWVCYTLDIDSNTPPTPEELSKEQASTVIEELGNMPDNPQMQAILEASGR